MTQYGPERLIGDLRALGLDIESVKLNDGSIFVVVPQYTIEVGKFAGRTIDLGVPATADFPRSVASSIHVKSVPHLYDLCDTIPNVRNIIASPLGPEWRYWSKNFNWSGERTVRRLISQINTIFLNA
jgi:hypothetical protein